MPENEPLSAPKVDSRVDDLYRAFLSRLEEKESDGNTSLAGRGEADDFLQLFFEEVKSVSRNLEALDREFARLHVSGTHKGQQRLEDLHGDFSRARRRLGQISKLHSRITGQPRPWVLPEMFRECLRFLGAQIRDRDIEVSIVVPQGIPPVVLRYPNPHQALFAMLHGIVEGFPTPRGRIVIRLSGAGDRVSGEVVAYSRDSLFERNRVPLAGLLPLWITDGVRIEREVSPGRFLLRLEFPCSRERESQRVAETAAPVSRRHR